MEHVRTQEPQELVGQTAYDQRGEEIGEIRGVYLDTTTKQPEWAAVDLGPSGVTLAPLVGATAGADGVRLALERTRVLDAPYGEPDLPRQVSEEDEAELYRHYGLRRPGARGRQRRGGARAGGTTPGRSRAPRRGAPARAAGTLAADEGQRLASTAVEEGEAVTGTVADEGRRVATRASDEGRQVAGAAAETGRRVATTASDEGRQVAGAAAETGRRVATRASDEGRQVARVTAQQAGEVAALAREQVVEVTEEITAQARALVEETKGQLQDQAYAQTERVASTLRRFGGEVQALAEGRPDDAGPLGDYVRQAADKLHQVADEIEARGPEGLLDEARTLARSRPGAFLLGAAVVGFGVGRMLRSAGGDEKEEDGDGGQERDGAAGQRELGRGAAALPPASTDRRTTAGAR